MKPKSLLIVAFLLIMLIQAPARQRPEARPEGGGAPAAGETPPPLELARQALARQGGDKFRNLKTLSLFGTAKLYYGARPSESTTGQFAIVQAGDRARIDIETPDVSYREIYDGKHAYSTLNPA